MKIAILGGAGAMGGVAGAAFAQAGHEVHLVDVNRDAVERVRRDGLKVESKDSEPVVVHLNAASDPTQVDICDLVVNFVKCYHTESAAESSKPMLGPETIVLSLQNGWGNGQVLSSALGAERVVVGVTYHSATLKSAGQVFHAGIGPTYIGRLDGSCDDVVKLLAAKLNSDRFPVIAPENVLVEIWRKLCLNICTLPVSGLLHLCNCQLIEHQGSIELMQALLREGVAVAKAHQIPISFEERWEFIQALLGRVGMSKSSMLQDVEAKRRTEIDVINGAIVQAGLAAGVPTPFNQSVTWMMKSLEETFT